MPVVRTIDRDGQELQNYVNPFFQQVDSFVKNELKVRQNIYGRRVRGVGASYPKQVEWSYGKTAWGIVTSKNVKGVTLGLPGSKVMSDSKGNLTLYNASRNVPNKPLLSEIEITNEGPLGSMLRGVFKFTIYPELTQTGFDLEGIEKAFFIPGNEVSIKWGWSVSGNSNNACQGEFDGIIYNFNWSLNEDLSVSATVSAVSPSAISMGISAEMTTKTDIDGVDSDVIDAASIEMRGSNLVKVIDEDLAALGAGSGSIQLTEGQPYYVPKESTVSRKLDYFAIGLPFQESEDTDLNNLPPPISQVFWYVKLGSIAEFINALLEDFDDPIKTIFRVQAFGNQTQYLKDIRSAFPIEVYFPDYKMGSYGDLNPFTEENSPLTEEMPENTINIGNILIGVDYIKTTFEELIEENSANINYKNLTKFLEEITKKINHASGNIYQLTNIMFEPKQNNIKNASGTSILSIEDFNLHTGLTVDPFQFDSTIFKPIIRDVNISCYPPGPSATAAFVAARGNTKPETSDVQLATNEQRDKRVFWREYTTAIRNMQSLERIAKSRGFNLNWSESYRAHLVKYKKTSLNTDAHWLNNAVYPIDLSITIDGINGFKFGDTLTTQMIPRIYNTDYNMVFTVSKIIHSVKEKDWQTTIETKSRITTIPGDFGPQYETTPGAIPGTTSPVPLPPGSI
jgi:hypothetical protein